ncbi:hypothetical protein [Wolinella succinogenes]|jgi:hypothetical protein|uniref:hypothetical protein n=1 Tax=Wolinella succinogenes TaxID=844 RepID=UPI00240983FC|nr:hypothetical protein [Wolinella succinogenes]
MSQVENSRREFLKSATKTTVVAAAVGVSMAGCMGGRTVTDNLTRGKSSKQETLYQKTAAWDMYYKSC